MAVVLTDNKHYTAIADKIREKTAHSDTMTPAEMSGKIGDVYEAGRFAERFRRWNTYQQGGNRTNYSNAFRVGWTNDIFDPMFDLTCTNASAMFSATDIEGDLVENLNTLGVKLDTSQATNLSSMFYNATKLTRVGIIDAQKASDITYMFESATALKTIDKVILKNDGSQTPNAFKQLKSLEKLTIEGTIGKNGFNAQHSTKLDHDSIVSIINALSTTTTGLSITISLEAVKKAFATSEGALDGNTSTEWTTLIGTKSNWTISLV